MTQEVSYKRDATIDLVKLAKGDADAVSYTNWEPKEAGKESFDNNPVQVVDGYVADYVVVPSQDVPKDENGKAQNGQNIVVKYSPVGKIIPVDKDRHEIPDASTPKYKNDHNDPTKTTTTDVPEIPGYHAEVPNVTPDKPGEDTKVVYVKNTQTIDLVYVDTTTGQTLTTQVNVAQGDSGSAIPTSVTDTLNATTQSYLDKGYVIDTAKAKETVPGEFDYSGQNTDGSDAQPQVVTVYLKHGTEIITSTDPKVPDEPVNPSNPGNPGTTTPDQPQQPGKPTDPTKPSEPNKPSKPGQPTNPDHPTKPTKPVTPAKPDQTYDQHGKVNGKTDLNGFVHGISDEKAGAVAGASDNAQAGAKKLPQTSGESGWQASLIGMGLFFISLFGFKKKKEDE